MSKKRASGGLRVAQSFSKLLLFQASGGNMGTKPEVIPENETMTFGEKRGFLDSLIRIAELERKSSENEENESGFDLIRRGIDARGTNRDRGNDGTSADSASDADSGSEDTEAGEESGS